MPRRTVFKTVDIDVTEVLEELDTQELEQELRERRPTEHRELLERLYTARAVGNREEQDRLIGLLIWEELGRVG